MSLPPSIRSRLTIPAVCAPMFLVTTPELVREACLAGVIGGLPRQNARSIEEFEAWLAMISEALKRRRDAEPDSRLAPIAVNLASNMSPADFDANLTLCQRYGVEIIINATGNPTELAKRAHDRGMLVWADAISMRFAEKAMSVGAEGIVAIGAGGGGHSGVVSHLALLAAIRQRFDGTLIMAGAVSTGAAIRAAEILGADLAYLGTRFIATQESGAHEAYKALLVSQRSVDLMYTPKIAGVAANWLMESMRMVGLDPANLPEPEPGRMGTGHLPPAVKPWANLWSAGQGIDQIDDIPTVAALVERLRSEYDAACRTPRFDAV
ncbi:MAG TPA: nitronate monooxygenase [Caulobacteraceae bacterium]|nr:nitronate monooxygenase [Caulobacteraceae bacterium]